MTDPDRPFVEAEPQVLTDRPFVEAEPQVLTERPLVEGDIPAPMDLAWLAGPQPLRRSATKIVLLVPSTIEAIVFCPWVLCQFQMSPGTFSGRPKTWKLQP